MKVYTDILGNQILPGKVIAYGVSGRGSKNLCYGIVSKITDSSTSVWTKSYAYTNYHGEFISGISKGKTFHTGKEMQEHIVVLENILYSIQNPNLANLVQLSIALIEQGLVPKNYKVGVAFQDLEEDEAVLISAINSDCNFEELDNQIKNILSNYEVVSLSGAKSWTVLGTPSKLSKIEDLIKDLPVALADNEIYHTLEKEYQTLGE